MPKITDLRRWRNGEIFNARDYVYERQRIVDIVNNQEDDIAALDTRLTTAEGEIDTLQTNVSVAQGDIDNLETRMTTAEGDIVDVNDALDTHTQDGTIHFTQSEISITESQISDLDKYTQAEVDALILAAKKIHYYPNTRNDGTVLIEKGDVVQFIGSQGDWLKIKKAVASEVNAQPETLMGIAEADIPVGQFGNIVWFGQVKEMNVWKDDPENPGQNLWPLGTVLYFDTVNGGLTEVRPSENIIIVAAVERAANNDTAENGILLVRVKWLSRDIDEIDGLQDELDTLQGYIDAIEADYVHNTSLTPGNLTIEGDRVDIISNAGNIYLEPSNNDAVVVGNLKVEGDLVVDGESIVADLERLNVANNTITLREGAATGLGSDFAGLIAENADGSNDSGLLFNGDGIARVGDITVTNGVITDTSSTQALATREDSPYDSGTGFKGIAHWDAQTKKFITKSNATIRDDGSIFGSYFRGAQIGNSTPQNSVVYFNSAGTVISRDIADGNPALIVNQANASSTGSLQVWQKEGSQKAYISNSGTLVAAALYDINNSSYYLDPASTSTSLNVAGDIQLQSGKKIKLFPNDFNYLMYYQWKMNTGNLVEIDNAGSGDMEFSTGNANVYLDNSTGNVGIGTTNPLSKLEVNSGISNTAARFVSTDANTNIAIIDNTGAALINGLGGALTFLTGYDTNISGGSEKMRIQNDGNVGIGDNNPSDKLVINGRTRIDGANWLAFGNSTGGYANIRLTGATTGTLTFNSYDGTNTTEKMRIENTGNVGIGTASPSTKLEVKGADSTITITNSASDGGSIAPSILLNRGGGGYGSYRMQAISAKYNIQYTTDNTNFTDRLTIDSDGNVGIGTTSPSAKLSLKNSGDTYLSIDTSLSANKAGILLSENNTPTTYGAELVYDGATNLFHIKSGSSTFIERLTITRDDGNVGIANTSPQEKLDVTGNARVSGQYQYGTNAYTEYNATDQTIDFVFN